MSQNEPVMSQRARFEHWFSDQGKWPEAVERDGDGYKLMQAQSAWEAWQAACPEGWQAVPVEPIEDQIDAGCEATGECERLGECHRDCDCSSVPKVYRAMLSAAPKPEDV